MHEITFAPDKPAHRGSHPLARTLVRHALAPLSPQRRRACEAAYAALPGSGLDDIERELAHVLAASGQTLTQCLDDLDAFNALTPEVDNDTWYDQARAFTSMHLDALLVGFSRRRLVCTRDQLLRCVPDKVSKVLEVGSGSGRLAGLLADAAPGWHFTLVDRSRQAVRFAAWLHAARGTGSRVLSLHGDLAHLPAPDHSVDVAIAAEVLEHAPDPRRSTAELLRVLRPGGWLAISLPVDLDIAMHPTVFRSEGEILSFFASFGLVPCEATVVAPDGQTDAIVDVFPGFAGCVNAVFRKPGQAPAAGR